MLFGGSIIVVENIENSLGVVLLLLFADVRDREQFGPGVWHSLWEPEEVDVNTG